MNPPKVPALGRDLNLSLKLGLEQRFGVLKSGFLFSASCLGDSWVKLNFLGKDLELDLGDSASMRSTQDCATIAREVRGVVRP